MSIEERAKRESERKRKRIASLVKDTAMFLFCAVGLFFLLNDLLFNIKGVPSSADVVRLCYGVCGEGHIFWETE